MVHIGRICHCIAHCKGVYIYIFHSIYPTPVSVIEGGGANLISEVGCKTNEVTTEMINGVITECIYDTPRGQESLHEEGKKTNKHMEEMYCI